ncbi:hypothetical protein AX14_013269, partial [Amanita brunnescens Koide BX004]
MAEISDSETTGSSVLSNRSGIADISQSEYSSVLSNTNEKHVQILRKQYKCPHFRILVIGRANAGKTTILEKVCGVAKGTKPIIYHKNGERLQPSQTHLMPSIERGMHDIEHQITYPGSNFIFHDSQGFESGATQELEVAWKFIEERSTRTELKDQLHAIWYCIPMDNPHPILATELQYFYKGTGNVPLVVVFTKFDGQIIKEYVDLSNVENTDKWEMARENAEKAFQTVYLPKVMDTKFPPKACVRLEDMDMPEMNCPEVAEKTADAVTDATMHQLFVSTQKNNLDLCAKSALQLLHYHTSWKAVMMLVLAKFPHFW